MFIYGIKECSYKIPICFKSYVTDKDLENVILFVAPEKATVFFLVVYKICLKEIRSKGLQGKQMLINRLKTNFVFCTKLEVEGTPNLIADKI